MSNLMTFFLLASSGLQVWAQQTSKLSTADSRSAMGSTISSPGSTRAKVSSTATATTAPIDTANVSQSVSSTLVSADTWRSHMGAATGIIMANDEAPRTLISALGL